MRFSTYFMLAVLWLLLPLGAVARPEGSLVIALGDPDINPHLAVVDVRSGEVNGLNNAVVSSPRVDPDGRLVIYSQVDGKTHVVNMMGLDHPGVDATLVPPPTDNFAVCWLNSKSFLAMVGMDLCRIGLNGSVEQKVAHMAFTPLLGDVTPDGKTLYYQDPEAVEVDAIKSMDLATGKITRLFLGIEPRLSRNGHWLVFLDTAHGRLMLYSTVHHTMKSLVTLDSGSWARSPVFSRDDLYVAYLGGPSQGSSATVHIVTTDGAKVKTIPLLTPADAMDWAR